MKRREEIKMWGAPITLGLCGCEQQSEEMPDELCVPTFRHTSLFSLSSCSWECIGGKLKFTQLKAFYALWQKFYFASGKEHTYFLNYNQLTNYFFHDFSWSYFRFAAEGPINSVNKDSEGKAKMATTYCIAVCGDRASLYILPATIKHKKITRRTVNAITVNSNCTYCQTHPNRFFPSVLIVMHPLLRRYQQD